MQLQKEPLGINVAYLHGPSDGHSCGYCKKKDGSYTSGFDVKQMDPEIYKSLMDCGWRRCGTYFYRPEMTKSCCKSYTIRMDAKAFEIKKSQKRALKKWNNFIYSEEKVEKLLSKEMKQEQKKQETTKKQSKNDISIEKVEKQPKNNLVHAVNYAIQDENQISLRAQVQASANELENIKDSLKIEGVDSSKLSFTRGDVLDQFKILPSKCKEKGDYFTNYFMLMFARNKENLNGVKINQFIEALSGQIKLTLDKIIIGFDCQLDLHGQLNFFVQKHEEKIIKSAPEKMQIEQNLDKPSSQENSQAPRVDQEPLQNLQVSEQVKANSESAVETTVPVVGSKTDGSSQEVKNSLSQQKDTSKDQQPKNDKTLDLPKKPIEFLKIDKKNNRLNHSQMSEEGQEPEKVDNDDTENINGDADTHFHWDSDKYSFQEIKKGRLTIKIQLAKADDTNFELYKRYCRDIHGKQKEQMEGFKGFLCEKTLTFGIKQSPINKDDKLIVGCIHMNYFLDDQLIAVGVVDISSEALSSVYFFYDPKYKKYSLGVVAALYEIEYIQKMNVSFPAFQHYYLGFYIQDCQKMVYKGDYSPAELLCPRTFKWCVLTPELKGLINSKPQDPSLSSPTETIDLRMAHIVNPRTLEKFVDEKTRVSFQNTNIPFKQFLSFFKPILKQTFLAIASIIDSNLYPNLIFQYHQ